MRVGRRLEEEEESRKWNESVTQTWNMAPQIIPERRCRLKCTSYYETIKNTDIAEMRSYGTTETRSTLLHPSERRENRPSQNITPLNVCTRASFSLYAVISRRCIKDIFFNCRCHYCGNRKTRSGCWPQKSRCWLIAKKTVWIQGMTGQAWVGICARNITSHYLGFDRHWKVERRQGERREGGRGERWGQDVRGEKKGSMVERGEERKSVETWGRGTGGYEEDRGGKERKESKERSHTCINLMIENDDSIIGILSEAALVWRQICACL